MQFGPPEAKMGSLLLMGAGPGAGASGTAEVTRVVTRADVGGDLHDKWFRINDAAGSVGVVFDHGGGTTPTGMDRDVLVAYTDDSAASTLADLLKTALDNDAAWSATVNSDTVDITDAAAGERTDAADGSAPTGFTITVTTQGA